jgi:hypothetical protein
MDVVKDHGGAQVCTIAAFAQNHGIVPEDDRRVLLEASVF